jgi:hypothetical protein
VREGTAYAPPERAVEAKRSMQETLAASQVLIWMAEACVATAGTLCIDAARLRSRAQGIRNRHTQRWQPVRTGMASFSLDGIVDGCSVHAEWREHRLVADPLLLERAELLVELQEEFLPGEPGAFTASLTGPPVVALVTLVRACDRVQAVEVMSELRPTTLPDER